MPDMYDIGDKEVAIAENGELKLTQTDTTPSGTGTTTTELTVPVGKKWLIKMIELTTTGFTGTVSRVFCEIRKSSYNMLIIDSTTTTTEKLGEQNITLSAGDILRCNWTLSAYTSGGVRVRNLYVEMDA